LAPSLTVTNAEYFLVLPCQCFLFILGDGFFALPSKIDLVKKIFPRAESSDAGKTLERPQKAGG
jgi:hypothetical protein